MPEACTTSTGSVVGGTLTVTDRLVPGGTGAVGTLLFETAPVLSGATVEVEFDERTLDSVLVTGGDADVSAARLSVVGLADYAGRKAAFFACEDGALAGPFAEASVPSGFEVAYGESAVVLRPLRGTLLLVK